MPDRRLAWEREDRTGELAYQAGDGAVSLRVMQVASGPTRQAWYLEIEFDLDATEHAPALKFSAFPTEGFATAEQAQLAAEAIARRVNAWLTGEREQIEAAIQRVAEMGERDGD